MSHDLEIEIRRKLQQTNRNMFKFHLKYRIDEEGDCLPLEITPKHISMNDYNINYNKVSRSVDAITHKTHGAVVFIATLFDEQMGYMLGSTMKIWTSLWTHE